jgi:serine/threonine-protein kinase
MALGGRVYSFGKLLLLCAALAGTFLLFAGVGVRVALRTREVQVPPLTGQTVAEASRLLGTVGLTIKIDEMRRPDPKLPPGRVVQQEPPAGAAARRQRTIRVWLSAGPRATTVADVVGQSERTARLRLDQDGVTIASTTDLHSPDYPTGVVVAQDPPPASNAPRVTLLVNRGAEAAGYLMPDLLGLDGRRTADALRGLGFRVTLVTSPALTGPASTNSGVTGTTASGTAVAGTTPPSAAPGAIVRQTPAPGFQLASGEAISLEVSR